VIVFAALAGAPAPAQILAPSPQFQASMDLVTALRARDVPKIMELMATDVILLPPGHDLTGGRREVEALLKEFLGKNAMELAFSSLGSSGSERLGFDVGQYELTLKPEGGAARAKSRGKYLAVYRQDEKERWKLAYLSWNSSEPSPTPTPTPPPQK
jgi:ketosteroid isomerase-like protein